MTPILENERYQLFMQGSVHKWTRTGTSDHYFDYGDRYHQWRGEGVIVDKKTGQSTQFSFRSSASRFGEPAENLKTLVTRTGRMTIDGFKYRQVSAEELALPNRESSIVMLVCERILEKISMCAVPIKTVIIDDIPLEELVKAGIVPDDSGQIHLGLTTQTGGAL